MDTVLAAIIGNAMKAITDDENEAASEYPVERDLRDVRFTLIGGGTSEILRGAIARGLYP